jgi:hypothetical protein
VHILWEADPEGEQPFLLLQCRVFCFGAAIWSRPWQWKEESWGEGIDAYDEAREGKEAEEKTDFQFSALRAYIERDLFLHFILFHMGISVNAILLDGFGAI